MKGYAVALAVLVALAAKNTAAFTPVAPRFAQVGGTFVAGGSAPDVRRSSVVQVRRSATVPSAADTDDAAFQLDDRDVRAAYEEWSFTFNKGPVTQADLNGPRYKNFRHNFQLLTQANVEARRKAQRTGRPMPRWMTLNQYGDYSRAEYQAVMRGEPLPSIPDEPSEPKQEPFKEVEILDVTPKVEKPSKEKMQLASSASGTTEQIPFFAQVYREEKDSVPQPPPKIVAEISTDEYTRVLEQRALEAQQKMEREKAERQNRLEEQEAERREQMRAQQEAEREEFLRAQQEAFRLAQREREDQERMKEQQQWEEAQRQAQLKAHQEAGRRALEEADRHTQLKLKQQEEEEKRQFQLTQRQQQMQNQENYQSTNDLFNPAGEMDSSLDTETPQPIKAPEPHIVQGGSLKTWELRSTRIQRVRVCLGTEGRPMDADIDLWNGPENTPVKIRLYVEDGYNRPFNVVLETPRGPNTVAVKNVAQVEFPLMAFVEPNPEVNAHTIPDKIFGPRIIQGGALRTFTFDQEVESIQIMLKTDGRPLNSRIELLQGPNNIKQVMEVYLEDGMTRPFFCIVETPGSGNVIRVVNTSTVEFPMSALVEPYDIVPENESTDVIISGHGSGGGGNW